MGAVGAAGEFEDHGAVDQAVEERRRQRWIAEVVGPGGEVDVGRQCGRTPAGAGVEQAVVEGAGLGFRLALQAVETEFVDQEKIESRILIEHPREGPVGQGRGELLEQLGAGRVPHAISLHARGVAHGLKNPALAQAGLTHQDHVLVPPHEVAGGQLLDGPPVQSLGVELPVEPVQGRQFAELRIADPSLQRPLKTGLSRAGKQPVQELQVAQRLFLRRRERRVERLRGDRDAQRPQCGRDVFMQAW